MDNLQNIMVTYGLAVSPETDGTWFAYVRENIFNDDDSEAYCIGATPLDAAEKSMQYWLMWSGDIRYSRQIPSKIMQIMLAFLKQLRYYTYMETKQTKGSEMKVMVGDVVAIDGTKRLKYEGTCQYTAEQMSDGLLLNTSTGRVWTATVQKIEGDMAFVAGGWRGIDSLVVINRG